MIESYESLPRVPVALRARYTNFQFRSLALLTGFEGNMIHLRSPRPVSVGEELFLRFTLPSGGVRVSLTGLVTSVKPGLVDEVLEVWVERFQQGERELLEFLDQSRRQLVVSDPRRASFRVFADLFAFVGTASRKIHGQLWDLSQKGLYLCTTIDIWAPEQKIVLELFTHLGAEKRNILPARIVRIDPPGRTKFAWRGFGVAVQFMNGYELPLSLQSV